MSKQHVAPPRPEPKPFHTSGIEMPTWVLVVEILVFTVIIVGIIVLALIRYYA